MREYILPGVLGLLLGLILCWTQLCRPAALRTALALRRSHALRSLLYFIGAGMALTALLMWLAVIDVDEVVVLPLSAGALIGGTVFGVAMALSGYTPLTLFAGIGSGQPLPALCTLAGCLVGGMLLPLLETPLSALRALPPVSDSTLFRTTLDEGYLLGGGFLGQGCAGALLMAIAACIPSNRASTPPEAASASPAAPPVLLLPAPAEPAPPQDAPEETFIALLPGEEPLVVDTALTDAESPPPEDTPPEEDAPVDAEDADPDSSGEGTDDAT